MRQVFRIREKLFFSALCGKDAQSLLILPFGVANAFRKQSFGISVSLQRTCNPKAVNINVSVRIDGNPCIFRRDLLNKTLAAFLAPVKHKAFVEPLLHPLFFNKALFARHGAADMLPVDVIFVDF